jgi:Uma2 family endonuclease
MSTATLYESTANLGVIPPAERIESDDALYEIVHGQRVEVPSMSLTASRIATRLGVSLSRFAEEHKLGEVIIEGLFHLPLSDDLSKSRRPDVAYISFARIAAGSPSDVESDAGELVPDLAIEVTSPSDPAEAQRAKVLEYFQAGVQRVWVVYPKLRLVDVFDSATNVRVFGPDDTIVGDPLLPGFRLPLAQLFAPFGAART